MCPIQSYLKIHHNYNYCKIGIYTVKALLAKVLTQCQRIPPQKRCITTNILNSTIMKYIYTHVPQDQLGRASAEWEYSPDHQ
jgi:hypothetical protein